MAPSTRAHGSNSSGDRCRVSEPTAGQVRRETAALKALIEAKSQMVVVENQSGRAGVARDPGADAPAPASSHRRQGAGAARRTRVIVDIREFRSQLPSLIHARGLEPVPVTLEVPALQGCCCLGAV